jgi:hypothetical protein
MKPRNTKQELQSLSHVIRVQWCHTGLAMTRRMRTITKSRAVESGIVLRMRSAVCPATIA